mgnify:CR=1 FL=1
MKNIRRYLGLTLLILAAIAMSSCIKENFTESLEDDRTTNVYLVLNSRVGEFDDNEDIKTLRLLVIDDNGTINFNRQIKPTSLPNNSVSFTLIGLKMGSGTKNFYVIANEESIGLNAADFESDYAEKKQLKGEWKTILKSLPVDENGVCFYQQASGIVTYGLPITGYTEDFLLKKDQNNLVEIDIIYAVSKIKMKFVNERLTEETINELTFKKVESKSGTTLFDSSSSLPIGSNDISFSSTINVPGATNDKAGETSVIFYVYENQKSTEGYSFTARWNNKLQTVDFDDIPFVENDVPKTITSLSRGQQLNITVRLKLGSVEVDDLELEVIPWGTKDVVIPPFN